MTTVTQTRQEFAFYLGKIAILGQPALDFDECSTFWSYFGSLKVSQMINLTTVSRFGAILLQRLAKNTFKMTPTIGQSGGALPEQGADETVFSQPSFFINFFIHFLSKSPLESALSWCYF